MIIGIGLDSVKIERMEKSLETPGFIKRVFHPREQEMLESRKGLRLLEGAAANFAVKEAFLKAVGTGIGGFALHEIATLREENGRPYLYLDGQAAEYCEGKEIQVHISITHEAGNATAIVILEER